MNPRHAERGRGCPIAIMLVAAVAGVTCAGRSAAGDSPYELVTVGNAGNSASLFGRGDVNYEFRMGKYEVTIGQYAGFLNAVASSDPYSLYHPNMGGDLNIAGIARSGHQQRCVRPRISPRKRRTPAQRRQSKHR